MGRSQRLAFRGALYHATMRCNNKEFLFEEESLRLFLENLAEACRLHNVALFNYCLMTNHVHLLFQFLADGVLSAFMHRVANVFANRFNRIRGRKGHLWEGRFRSTILEATTCFLPCMAYIDLNPVRARMVQAPGDYPWSGHHLLASEDETLIKLHRIYLECGKDRAERFATYQRVLREEAERAPYSLANALLMGSRPFIKKLEREFGLLDIENHRLQHKDLGGGIYAVELRRGRPRKAQENQAAE